VLFPDNELHITDNNLACLKACFCLKSRHFTCSESTLQACTFADQILHKMHYVAYFSYRQIKPHILKKIFIVNWYRYLVLVVVVVVVVCCQMTLKDIRLSPAFRQACRDDVQHHCLQHNRKYVVVAVVAVVADISHCLVAWHGMA